MTILLYVTKVGRGNVRPQRVYRASPAPSLLPTYQTLVLLPILLTPDSTSCFV